MKIKKYGGLRWVADFGPFVKKNYSYLPENEDEIK